MTRDIIQPPRTIEKEDDVAGFSCGVESLDKWLKENAWKNQRANNSVTYVTTLNDKVVGYYALASGGVSRDALPKRFRNNRPKDVPIILLGRFAVDSRAQGRQLGKSLLQDMFRRAIAAAEIIGAAALLIHAHDESAKQFYLHNANFHEMPGEPLHLLLPVESLIQQAQNS